MVKKLSLFFVMFSLLLLSSCDIALTKRGQLYIVGVALDYTNSLIMSNLRGTIADVTEMGSAITLNAKAAGHEVNERYLLQIGEDARPTDSDYPSRENIIKLIDNMKFSKGDAFIFIYSGHGMLNEATGKSCIVMGESDTTFSLVSYDELFSLLDKKGVPVLLIMDSCYSGEGVKDESDNFINAFSSLFEKRSYASLSVIAACEKGKLSYETSIINDDGIEELHGSFTSAFLSSYGWRHAESSIRSVKYQGGKREYPVKGYLSHSIESGTTARSFFGTVVNENFFLRQKPITNLTSADIIIGF